MNKRRNKMTGWIIALVIVAGLAIAGWISWSKLEQEHQEARSLPLDRVDFGDLKDGVYHGHYEGGMYRWRRNDCEVTVASGKVADIKLVTSSDPGMENMDPKMLYDRVIKEQSLQVDTISGATLTSKAYLQAVENALVQSQTNE
ncbi:MAG: FMN-binding protein [Leptolinea sp.]|nr:FMN-binding protein [Leptolinea sp.]